jgi:hypothetical protein
MPRLFPGIHFPGNHFPHFPMFGNYMESESKESKFWSTENVNFNSRKVLSPFYSWKTLSFPFSLTNETNLSEALQLISSKNYCVAVNLPFSYLIIGTKIIFLKRGLFLQVIIFLKYFYILSVFLFPVFYLDFYCDCGINLVSLLILEKKSEQFHALFCIRSEILLACLMCVLIIFSFSSHRHISALPHFFNL